MRFIDYQRKSSFRGFGLILLLGATTAWGADPLPSSGPIVPELMPLAHAMTNFMGPRNFEAGTIAVLKDDRLVLRQGFGWRDRAKTVVIQPDSMMRLASVSKTLTGSAITKLVDSGKLAYSTPIYALLGIQPLGGTLGDARITKITVQQLLDHTAGWDRNVGPVFDPVFDTIQISQEAGLNHPAEPTDVIRWMLAKPLQNAPGTVNSYSNFGYDLLGRVIEKVSGKSYVDYLRQDLFGPVGITNIIQSRSRPQDRDPREIWYASGPLERSAIDFPSNVLATFPDGGGYMESFDAFGGMAASAVELCHYAQHFFVSSRVRPTAGTWSWNYVFYGSLPGTTAVIHQDLHLTSSSTNALEFAALFNNRTEGSAGEDNEVIHAEIVNAASGITSWPVAAGGEIQWAVTGTNVFKNVGTVSLQLRRTGGNSKAVKVSYTTSSQTASSTDYTPQSGILTFGTGETTQTVVIPITNTALTEPAKTFTVELTSASGGAWLGNQFTTTVRILSPPRLAGEAAGAADGHFTLRVTGAEGASLRFESSDDLSHWQSLGTISQVTSNLQWKDPSAPPALGRRYYRAVVVE